MAKFTVLRTVDAFVRYSADVEAETAEQAARLAQADEDKYQWEEDSVSEYDARSFTTLNAEGDAIASTTVGDLL